MCISIDICMSYMNLRNTHVSMAFLCPSWIYEKHMCKYWHLYVHMNLRNVHVLHLYGLHESTRCNRVYVFTFVCPTWIYEINMCLSIAFVCPTWIYEMHMCLTIVIFMSYMNLRNTYVSKYWHFYVLHESTKRACV